MVSKQEIKCCTKKNISYYILNACSCLSKTLKHIDLFKLNTISLINKSKYHVRNVILFFR